MKVDRKKRQSLEDLRNMITWNVASGKLRILTACWRGGDWIALQIIRVMEKYLGCLRQESSFGPFFTTFIEILLMCEVERLLQRERKRHLVWLPCMGGGEEGQQSLSSSTPESIKLPRKQRGTRKRELCKWSKYFVQKQTSMWSTSVIWLFVFLYYLRILQCVSFRRTIPRFRFRWNKKCLKISK